MSEMIKRLGGLVSPYIVAFVLGCAVLLVLTAGHKFQLSDFSVQGPGDQATSVDLPHLTVGRGPMDYTFTGVLETSWFGPSTYQIIPDDQVLSIKVNGLPVDLSAVDPSRLRNVKTGFSINLGQHFDGSRQSIEVTVRDFGGEFGLAVNGSFNDVKRLLLIVGWILVCFIPYFYFLRRSGLPVSAQLAYLLVVVGSVVQVWYIFQYNPVDHIFSDPKRHWEQGTDLLRADLMALTDPIGYQLYIAALAKFTLKIPALVAYCTSILALLAPWVWYRFFRELQSSKTIALWGWAILSILPSWTAIYGYFMQETLMLPLLGASMWATWRCRRKADAASFVLMVLLWVVAGLTRGIAIPLAAVCCTWLWVAQDLKFKKAAYSLVVLGLIMGPLTYRSYQMVGHFAPHGMGHLNVVYAKSGKKVIEIQSRRAGYGWGHGFGSPSTGAKPFYPLSDWQTQREGTVRIKVDLDEGTRDWDKAVEAVDFDFKRYLWITKENIYFVFFAESWPDNNLARVVDIAGAVIRWVWAPLFIVVLIGLVVYRRKISRQWMLPSMLLAWFCVQVLTPISVNEGRYRKPLEGLLIAHVVLLLGARKGLLKQGAAAQTFNEFMAPINRVLPSPIFKGKQLSDER